MTSKEWISSIFVKAIENCSNEQDRLDIAAWLALAREKINDDSLSATDKFTQLYKIMDLKKSIGVIFNSITESIKNYSNSNLPLATKIAIPATLAAATLIGGQSAGVAGFGSAVGLPVLLLIFIGTSGITVILESILGDKDAKSYINVVMTMIAKDEILRRINKDLQDAMMAEPAAPKRKTLSAEIEQLKKELLTMNPYDFERHIMAFFQDIGMLSWVTKKTNDVGVDGFARHSNGLIVVQCKRNAENNFVGSPIVQQFKGVIEENGAWRGFIVTTSYFSKNAVDSANKSEKIKLIDLNMLINLHLKQNNLDDLMI